MLRFIAALLSVVVVLVAFSAIAVANAELFNIDRFHMVDHFPQSNAYLFRSNQPSVKGSNGKETFAYNEIYQGMVSRAATQINMTTFPPANKVYIVDIALNEIFESGVFENYEFFKKNPQLGKWINWPVVGDILHPEEVSDAERRNLLLNGTVWKIDKIPSRLVELRNMLLAGPPSGYDALAVVYHCAAGCDRTGEFSMSYMLQYAPALAGGRYGNFTDLYQADCSSKFGCGRCSNWFATGGAAWYCLYWNMFNSTAAGLPQYNDCMTAYRCKFLKSCEPSA